MNLEKIREEWAKDSVIDKIDMDKVSLETPKLHSKCSPKSTLFSGGPNLENLALASTGA